MRSLVFDDSIKYNEPGIGLIVENTDYSYTDAAGNIYDNSVVSACVQFTYRKLCETVLGIYEYNEDTDEWLLPESYSLEEQHILNLFKTPNDYYNINSIWFGILHSLAINGTGYVWIPRTSLLKEPAGLYYLSHNTVAPASEDNSTLIEYYVYSVNGKKYRLEKENVVRIPWGIDFRKLNVGYPIFGSVTREIGADNEAATSFGALMKNNGNPGVIISPKLNMKPMDTTQRNIFEALFRKFRGRNKGGLLVPPVPVDVQQIGFSPEQMQIGTARNDLAARICAPYGLDPMVLSLPSENKTYSNYGEALDAALENCVIPQLTLLGDCLTTFFDKELNLTARKRRISFDIDKMRGLQEDKNKLHERLRADWREGIIDRFTVKSKMKYKTEETDKEVYYEKGGINNVAPSANAEVK